MFSLGLTSVACYFVGMLYPMYASFKAIETRESGDDTQWLTYWVVYMSVETFEEFGAFIIGWLPLYYEMKLMFLIWMFAPQTHGAKFLYDTYIKPFLIQHASKIDPIFKRTEQALNSQAANTAATAFEKYAPQYGEKLANTAQAEANRIAGMLKEGKSQ